MENFISDFSQLPLSIVYGFEDPNDQISMLNKLITDSIAEHAPVKITKFTRPPALWMKDTEIITARNHLENLRITSRNSNNADSTKGDNYKNARNSYKNVIKQKKALFLRKALSSKKPKEVWQTVNRIIHPSCFNNLQQAK